MSRAFVSFLATAVLLASFPFVAYAFPFGGQINIFRRCYNQAIYANLGPPRGGPYIWTTSTKTYQFGPPLHAGQWLLGLASAPYYCIISIRPVIVWSGLSITMMGNEKECSNTLFRGLFTIIFLSTFSISRRHLLLEPLGETAISERATTSLKIGARDYLQGIFF